MVHVTEGFLSSESIQAQTDMHNLSLLRANSFLFVISVSVGHYSPEISHTPDTHTVSVCQLMTTIEFFKHINTCLIFSENLTPSPHLEIDIFFNRITPKNY